jgi:hypothetical protein
MFYNCGYSVPGGFTFTKLYIKTGLSLVEAVWFTLLWCFSRYEFFKAAGPVSDVYIAQDDNGSRGFGFVKMDTEEGVAKVMSSGPHPHAKQCLWIIFFQYLSWLRSFGVVLISYLHAAPCRHLN